MSKSLAVMACLLPLCASLADRADATTLLQAWVSSSGKDANACTRLAPCATFAGAIAKIGGTGAVSCVDSGTYGPFTITKPLKIVCDGLDASVAAASGVAVTVAAGATDAVLISGLDIQNSSAATTGIKVTKAGNVEIRNTSVEGFSTEGIYLLPTAVGANVAILKSQLINDGFGLYLDSTSAAHAFSAVLLQDTFDTGNKSGNVKVVAPNSPTGVVIDGSTLNGSAVGVTISGAYGLVRLRNSMVSANSTGLTATGGAGITSNGTNQITDNTTAGTSPTQIGAQ